MLEGKRILVTGASSGIGQEISIALADKHANVILLARNEGRLKQTVSKMNTQGENNYIVCDITDDQALQTVVAGLPKLDGVVFCAGVNEYVPLKFINRQKIEKMFNVNYFSSLLILQKLVKSKLLNRGSSIVFISSIASQLGVPATTLYAATKAAVNSSVKVLAVELAPMGIRVNAISPGIVKTPMLENSNVDESQFTVMEQNYPLGLGLPSDVAGAVAFHLSDESRWLTGNNMILDGGFTLQ